MIPASVILDNSVSVFYIRCDSDFNIIYTNEHFKEYVSHISPTKLVHFISQEEDFHYANKAIEKCLETTPMPVGFQCRMIQKNGSFRWSVWEVVGDSDVFHLIGIQLFDVVSISAHEYEKQQKILEKIAWIQSHKVRRPLTSIMRLADLVHKELSKSIDAETREVAEMLNKAAKEFDGIVKEIIEAASSNNKD